MVVFITDTSTQQTNSITTSSGFTTKSKPNITFSPTTGIYYPSADNFRIYTNNTDALTIDNSGILYGNGTGITNVSYTNLTNKPSTFPSDFTTMTNKPSYYPADFTNYSTTTAMNSAITTALNGYDTVTARNTALLPYITGTALNSCNYITTSTSTLVNYSTTTAMNGAISTSLIPYINYTVLNSCNFITASVSTLANYSTTTSMNSAITTALTGYDTIALRNTALIPYINYTALNSCNYINASVSTLANYSTTTAMNSAISTSLIPYINYTALNSCNYITASVSTLANYSTTTAMNNAITTALTPYDTIALRNTVLNSCNYITNTTTGLTSYSTTTAMNNAITTALTPYSTTTAMNAAITTALNPYDTIALRNTAINSCNYITNATTGLTNYSTTTAMNAAITTALTPYSTTTAMNAALSSYLPLLGGNITGNLTVNGNTTSSFTNSTTPTYSLDISQGFYKCPLLSIDAGIYGGNGTQNPRAIGQPLMKLGKSAWTGAGDYYGMGFGYAIGITDCCACEIGCMITNSSSGEVGDLIFSTRSSTTPSTPATERMRITSSGAISTPTFSTSSYNNIVMKTMTIPPYTLNGSPYGNTAWYIDIHDYVTQDGWPYLFLNIRCSGHFWWMGRVIITNSNSISNYADMGTNIQLGFATSNGRYQIQVSSPDANYNANIFVKIFG